MIYEDNPEQIMFMSVEEYREYRFMDRMVGFAVGVVSTVVFALAVLYIFG